jgi:hypothetical protein
MLIEGIELRVQDAIGTVYGDKDDGLCSAIATVTNRGGDVRKKLPRGDKSVPRESER